MKIGIDCRLVLDPQNEHGGGIERYAFTLATEMMRISEHDFVIFLPKEYQSPEIFSKRGNVEVHFVEKENIPFWDSHPGFVYQVHGHRLDLFYSPSSTFPIGLKTPSIVTVHDFAIYTHPEWFPGNQWFSKNVVVPQSLRKSKHIVAVSEKSKRDCMRLFNIDKKKISVVYNALPNPEYFYKIPTFERNLPKQYIVFIGTLEPRKNLNRIFKAYISLKRDSSYENISLVVVGNEGWGIEEVFKKYSKEELEENDVIFMENVTEREKWKILKNASLLFFPSLYEGFGLPVLEALSVDTPVITSKRGALQEVGRGDVEYVDPESVSDMVSSLKKALREPKKTIADVSIFSRKRFRKEIKEIIAN